MERRRRREWDEQTRMDAEKLVKIPKDSIPAGRKSPGRRKQDGTSYSLIKIGGIAYNKEEEEGEKISLKIRNT
jgi:hypothetical protein